MKTINVNQTIENYLGKTAGKSEEVWLLEGMKSDPALAREVELRRKTDQIIADQAVMDLRKKLAAIEIKKRSSGTVRRTVARAAKYAAAVALLAVTATILYYTFRDDSSGQLYGKYYARYETPANVRSVTGTGNSLMQSALAAYNAKEYGQAIDYLEQLVAGNQGGIESVFMHGVASMELKDYSSAEGSFNKVIEHNDNLYLEDATWYLGLCYMMTDEKDKALRQFEAIAASKSRYSKQAERLAKRLK